MEPVELLTERLALRPPRPEDAPDVTRACQDEETQRWLPLPTPYERKHADEWIAQAPENWAADGELKFVAVERAGGSLVGAMSLHAREPGMREIGYWTAPWARRRGFTVEAALRICRWGFDDLALRRIEWQAEVGNTGSRAVAERVGFRVEGTLRARLVHRGSPVDGWVAGLLPSDLS
jgi:RimJ/RimL family protein N-acetyltransferase